MSEKMSWEERWHMHHYERKKHSELARAALQRCIESGCNDMEAWEEYRRESKIASKHYGIANAMYTRKYGKT